MPSILLQAATAYGTHTLADTHNIHTRTHTRALTRTLDNTYGTRTHKHPCGTWAPEHRTPVKAGSRRGFQEDEVH